MGNEITVGMKFGTFDSFVTKTSKRAARAKIPSAPCYTKQFYNKKGKLFAEAWYYDDVIMKNGKRTEIAGITAYDENFQYTARNEGAKVYYPNKFTRIDTDTQYAIDKNSNGVVDKGEIFSKK